jgi:hypothetical protein
LDHIRPTRARNLSSCQFSSFTVAFTLDVRLVSVSVGSIPTHLHASIRLTLRYLLANSLDKLYRLGLLCSMFAGREGFEPVMPARPGSLSARGLRFNCHLAENN